MWPTYMWWAIVILARLRVKRGIGPLIGIFVALVENGPTSCKVATPEAYSGGSNEWGNKQEEKGVTIG